MRIVMRKCDNPECKIMIEEGEYIEGWMCIEKVKSFNIYKVDEKSNVKSCKSSYTYYNRDLDLCSTECMIALIKSIKEKNQ